MAYWIEMPHPGEGHIFPGWFTPQYSHLCRNRHRVQEYCERLKSMQMGIPEVAVGDTFLVIACGVFGAMEGRKLQFSG